MFGNELPKVRQAMSENNEMREEEGRLDMALSELELMVQRRLTGVLEGRGRECSSARHVHMCWREKTRNSRGWTAYYTL